MSTDKELGDIDNQIRSLVGEIPSWIFEYLELSDEIKKEWKFGNKASDFGGHNQFVQKFTNRISKAVQAREKRIRLEAKIEENQTYLDRINNWKPKPGQLTTAHFGSAGAGMETSGWKHAFEDRIKKLNSLNSKEGK